MTRFFDAGGTPTEINEVRLREWVQAVHDSLNSAADQMSIKPRELACTLLLAVIGKSTAAFVQVGDGAIVTLKNDAYCPVFWPQTGEYQNTTFFVTDPEFGRFIQCKVEFHEVTELALFTDGLQMLALNYSAKTAHSPFFQPMFRILQEMSCDELVVPMRQFLNSQAVNDRTDDDKTLILATRVSPGGNNSL